MSEVLEKICEYGLHSNSELNWLREGLKIICNILKEKEIYNIQDLEKVKKIHSYCKHCERCGDLSYCDGTRYCGQEEGDIPTGGIPEDQV